MTNEFTAWCTQYYQLTTQFSAYYERYKILLEDAPIYDGQNSLTELDAMVSYERRIETARVKGEKMYKKLTDTARTIIEIMKHFKIPPRKVLIGQIPGELEYEIWANEKDDLFIGKIKDLPPLPENPNIIRIKCSMPDIDD